MARSCDAPGVLQNIPVLAIGGSARDGQGKVDDVVAFAVQPRGLIVIFGDELVCFGEFLQEAGVSPLSAVEILYRAVGVKVPRHYAVFQKDAVPVRCLRLLVPSLSVAPWK